MTSNVIIDDLINATVIFMLLYIYIYAVRDSFTGIEKNLFRFRSYITY